MKIALKIPYSLDLTLAAIAKSLINQTAIINTFIVICDMESDTTTLKLNFFSDIETIFKPSAYHALGFWIGNFLSVIPSFCHTFQSDIGNKLVFRVTVYIFN